jgi:hypothetical protein
LGDGGGPKGQQAQASITPGGRGAWGPRCPRPPTDRYSWQSSDAKTPVDNRMPVKLPGAAVVLLRAVTVSVLLTLTLVLALPATTQGVTAGVNVGLLRRLTPWSWAQVVCSMQRTVLSTSQTHTSSHTQTHTQDCLTTVAQSTPVTHLGGQLSCQALPLHIAQPSATTQAKSNHDPFRTHGTEGTGGSSPKGKFA